MAIVLTVYHTMSRILRRKKQGPVRAKKKVVDGIEFKSGLEAYMYKALKEAGIQAEYEGVKYELTPSFDFNNNSYERQGNGKGEYKNRGGKKYLRSLTHLILQEQGSSLSVKEGQTNLFLYVGNYLRNMSANDFIALLYINHKTKKNATKP